jgi:hypothetical protein
MARPPPTGRAQPCPERSYGVTHFGRPNGLHRIFAVFAGGALTLALTAPVFAATTVTRFSDVYVSGPEDLIEECTGVAGTLTGTGVITGTQVETDQGFHWEATNSAVLSFSFVNGSYATGTVDEHLSFNTGYGAIVFTNAHYDTVTLYSANGALLWTASFRVIEHFTATSDGTVRAEFEIGHFRGGC